MGLTASDNHRFILEINCLWQNPQEDGIIYAVSKKLTDNISSMVKKMKIQDIQGVEAYNLFFVNDAMFD